ncbi:nuclear factor erythroid 2-related factor 3 isoform X2 [Xenopus laevis]|uniref:Nuclear factor erythroid 2-related factor 3 isoform X2 n=1 Tax=Xenopus laevis TaxID=8355 RepID=A0A8J1L1M4_XENLA|nr:nuclear factor erythroid 2-related factor 3 isoform X2 [Xenopus laevis]
MKDLKKYLTEGLLQFTILLSLVGVRVDIYLPPIREIIQGTSSAYSQIPFHNLRDTWEGSSLHPKSPDLDSFFTAKRLLEQVRALGGTRVPRTEVSAWLVHADSGDAEEGSFSADQTLLPADSNEETRSSTDSPANNHEGPSQQSSRSTLHQCHASPSQQQHIGPGASPTSSDYTKEKQEEKLDCCPSTYDYNSLHSESGKTELDEDVALENIEEPISIRDSNDIDLSGEDNQRIEIDRNTTEPSLFFEDFIQLLAQTENTLEITLEDIQPVSNVSSCRNSSTQNADDFGETLSQDVTLREVMFPSNLSSRRDENLGQRSEPFSPLNSSTNSEESLNPANLVQFLPSTDNSTRNLTTHDLFSGIDDNVFDEINLMSLALEEGFDPLEVSQLFEEPDSDSGLSLNSSHSPTSVSISDSSSVSFGEDEGAAGYSSDSESVLYDGLEGAVGSSWPEINKFSHLDYQQNYCDNITMHNVHHNHTYNQFPNQLEPVRDYHYSLTAKQGKLSSPCASGMDKNLSRDERRAKSLRIPFSVDEIVSMPVEMFNNMLSKHCLTESQVTVIRDIRRRGKNKVAAQNCRKRKLDVILNLEDDVGQLQARKEKLLKERAQCSKSMSHMKQKLNDLYRDVFSKLRDEQGRPVNPSLYALHCNSDGSIMVVPRRLFKSEQKQDMQKEKKKLNIVNKDFAKTFNGYSWP